MQEILGIVSGVSGVQQPHNLKTRKIGPKIAMDIHIQVSRALNIVEAHDISTEVERKLKDKYGQDMIISVHAEPLGDSQQD